MTINERSSVVSDYLFNQSKPVYDCLMYTPNEKCFLYNSKDGVYASKKYRIEDMTMKYPHTYKTIINNPHACDDGVYVVVGSPVGPRQFTERVATREAWGSIRDVDGHKYGVPNFFS